MIPQDVPVDIDDVANENKEYQARPQMFNTNVKYRPNKKYLVYAVKEIVKILVNAVTSCIRRLFSLFSSARSLG